MPLLTHKMPLEYQDGDIKWIFGRGANHNKFFNERFQVVIHLHPGHPCPKTLVIRFTESVWCLNKKLTIIFRFPFMLI